MELKEMAGLGCLMLLVEQLVMDFSEEEIQDPWLELH